MMRLFGLLYGMAGSMLAGAGAVVALVSGWTTLWPILIAAGIGAAVAVPVCWAIARRITRRGRA